MGEIYANAIGMEWVRYKYGPFCVVFWTKFIAGPSHSISLSGILVFRSSINVTNYSIAEEVMCDSEEDDEEVERTSEESEMPRWQRNELIR